MNLVCNIRKLPSVVTSTVRIRFLAPLFTPIHFTDNVWTKSNMYVSLLLLGTESQVKLGK